MARQYINVKTSTGGTTPLLIQALIPNHVIGFLDNLEDLWQTTDLGQTWTQSALSGTTTQSKSLCYASSTNIIAGSLQGRVDISQNGGISWAATQFYNESPSANCISAFNNSIVVVGDVFSSVIYAQFSPDNGITWHDIGALISAAGGIKRDSEFCYMSSDTEMYVIIDTGELWKVVFDGGTSFTITNKVNPGGKITGIIKVGTDFYCAASYYTAGATHGILKTTDDFNTYSLIVDARAYKANPITLFPGFTRLLGMDNNILYHSDIDAVDYNGWTYNIDTDESIFISTTLATLTNRLYGNLSMGSYRGYNSKILFLNKDVGVIVFDAVRLEDGTDRVFLGTTRDRGQTWDYIITPADSLSVNRARGWIGPIAAFNIDTGKSINSASSGF